MPRRLKGLGAGRVGPSWPLPSVHGPSRTMAPPGAQARAGRLGRELALLVGLERLDRQVVRVERPRGRSRPGRRGARTPGLRRASAARRAARRWTREDLER